LQIGIDSFAVVISDPAAAVTLSPIQHMDNLLESIVLRPGCLDVFGWANTIAASLWISVK